MWYKLHAAASAFAGHSAARERERLRLARELHDQTLQTLGTLAMLLDSLTPECPEGFEATHATARRLIDEEIDSLRRMIAGLRQVPLEALGLVPALEALAVRVTEMYSLPVAFEADLRADAARLPARVEEAIYRVVQEGLRNVVRHADATRAVVGLRMEDGALIVSIEDDGQGIDPAARRGFGLDGMRERLALIGGQLELESVPGSTRIVARVPRS